jgi:hypothetical protein
MKTLMRAALEYIRRLKGVSFPAGKDHLIERSYHGLKYKDLQWYPTEKFACCRNVKNKKSYMQHCKSLTHVAHLFRVLPESIKEFLNSRQILLLMGTDLWVDEYVAAKLKSRK